MTRLLTALAVGLIFGVGLGLGGMLNPAKVVGFLDFFGHWDPSLAFVMGGGVLVNAIGLRFILRQNAPLQFEKFSLPTARDIDAPLVVGSVVFGIGWALAGLCPGPVVASLLLNRDAMPMFLGLLIAGLLVGRFVMRRIT